MAQRTSIEWTDYSWNPIRAADRKTGKVGHYCEKISPGCANCYASAFQPRFGLPMYVGEWQRERRLAEMDLYLDDHELRVPVDWRKPRKVFVCSMTDLFGDWVPDAWIDWVFHIMSRTPHHTYMVLTKRAWRMENYIRTLCDDSHNRRRFDFITTADIDVVPWPLPNVWLGVSVENTEQMRRIEYLLKCPAVVRWLSMEPLLGPVDLASHLRCAECCGKTWDRVDANEIPCPACGGAFHGIDWCVIGGESGRGARPCHLEWIRSLVRQCREVNVPPFVKQFGSNFHSDGEVWPEAPRYTLTSMCNGVLQNTTEWNRRKNGRWKFRNSKGSLMDEWPEDVRVREYPTQGVQER